MPTLNLGILAHVDAGKTTLTERLLFEAGVIKTPGSVDAGSTQTDSLPLERQRGITIKTGVVSFAIGDTTVNLIDTPGHPDFIAEVERALGVLDGVVLVVSAVEGVQPQTRVLMRALQRLRVPTVIFVNKTDRRGARGDDLVVEMRRRLSIGDECPVYFGSARTGEGVDALRSAIVALLPPASGARDAPLSALVFKIDRGRAGEKICYVRVFDGALQLRQRVQLAGDVQCKVTRFEAFGNGPGQIAKVWGLAEARVGDVLGNPPRGRPGLQFGPPTLEAVVLPRDNADGVAVRTALNQLAEQDPLINVRYDADRHELSVSLYGEVQKEVVQATLADDFGLVVGFGETRTVYVERPRGTGAAEEVLTEDRNPTSATMALRVEPGEPGSGVTFTLAVDGRTMPTYIFRSAENFASAMTEYVRDALREGLSGWEVTDCRVTMTRCGYYIGDGPTKPTRPTARTTAADFRNLTPLVLMRALERAGTVVCGPVMRVRTECPTAAAGRVLAALQRLGGSVAAAPVEAETAVVEGALPSGQVHTLRRDVTRITSGEGVVEAAFAGYQPVRGRPPTRVRTTPNPLNRKSYFLATFRHRPVRGGEYG